MYISEESVRELIKRVDVTYEEAEYYLKRTKGDMNMAVFLIMKKRNSSWEKFKSSLWELMKYKFIMARKGEVIINLPLLLLIAFILLYGVQKHIFPLIIIFVIVLITECEVKIEKVNDIGEPFPKKPKNSSNSNKPENHEPYNKYQNQQTSPEHLAHSPNNKQKATEREKAAAQGATDRKPTEQKTTKQENSYAVQNDPINTTVIPQKTINHIEEAEDDYYEIVIED